MTHTAGSWHLDYENDAVYVCAPEGWAICSVDGDDQEQAEANARLIAAAPDLLNELEKITDTLESMFAGVVPSHYRQRINTARSVIAKATEQHEIAHPPQS